MQPVKTTLTCKFRHSGVEVDKFYNGLSVHAPCVRSFGVLDQQWHPCVGLVVGVLAPVVVFAQRVSVVAVRRKSKSERQKGR